MSDIEGGNPIIRRNNLIFAILTVILHIIACFMYGFFIVVPSQLTNGSFVPIFIVFAHGLLVVVGFGLLFSYIRRLLWTGMGFTLLITALSIEFYLMINVFWTKADVNNNSQTYFADEDKTYSIYLTNVNQTNNYMATITGGFRCALAMLVAFSSILGRAGPLEAWFVVIVGTIGYQLNRQIVQNFTQDSGGSSTIFVFGGVMSIVIGILRKIKDKDVTIQNQRYSANTFSAMLALLGTLFIWIFFPILTSDYIRSGIALHTPFTGAYTVMYSIAAATIASFATSMILHDGLLIRDIIYGPIAGGVISSSPSFYVTNPVYGILIGLIAGIVQVVLMNKVESKIAQNKSIISTFSFTLFAVQGMLAGIFAGAWNAISRGQQTNGFSYNYNDIEYGQVYSWLMSLVSAAMGICFGFIAGGLCLAVSGHQRQDTFVDNPYWVQDDGIRTTNMEKDDQIQFRQGAGVKERNNYL